MQNSDCCLTATLLSLKENSQKQTHTSRGGRPLLQQLFWGQSSANIYATEVTQFQSHWVRAKLFQLIFQLRCYYNASSVRRPPQGPHMTEWRIWAQTERKHFSSFSTTTNTTTPTDLGFFHGLFLCLFRLFSLCQTWGKTLYLPATSVTQTNSLSCGIQDTDHKGKVRGYDDIFP